MVTNSKKLLLPFLGLLLFSSCAKNEGVSLQSGGQTKKLFVTNSTTTGNIGGIAGADSKCMADSNYPGSGTYKALLVDGTARTTQVDWVLLPDTEYSRVSDGIVVGTTDSDGLLLFNLDNPVDASYNYWIFTGLNSDWTSDTSNDCTNWTDTGGFGSFGFGDKTDTDAISAAQGSCTTSVKLICVEQ